MACHVKLRGGSEKGECEWAVCVSGGLGVPALGPALLLLPGRLRAVELPVRWHVHGRLRDGGRRVRESLGAVRGVGWLRGGLPAD